MRPPPATLGDPLAPEYQMVDDVNHPNGKKPETATGSVFSLIGPSKDVTKPVGQWYRDIRITAIEGPAGTDR